MPGLDTDGEENSEERNEAHCGCGGTKGTRHVYFFGKGKAEGDRSMRDVLGGKGAGLAEMTNAGLPVPPGFTISTGVCTIYYQNKGKLTPAVEQEMIANLRKLEQATGDTLGSAEKPLLVSVRSGAKFSMPGMMDTILNLGLNDVAVEGLRKRTQNGRFAYDSYRRFIRCWAASCSDSGGAEHEFEAVKRPKAKQDPDSTRRRCARWSTATRKSSGRRRADFPQDPPEQPLVARRGLPFLAELRAGIPLHLLDPHHIGTAVNVCRRWFGNTGDRSGTGVGFSATRRLGPKSSTVSSDQRTGRGRRRRHPHAKPIAELQQVMPRPTSSCATSRRGSRSTTRTSRTSSSRSRTRTSTCSRRNGKRTGYAAVVIATDLVGEARDA